MYIGFLFSVLKEGSHMDLYSFLIYIHLSLPSLGGKYKLSLPLVEESRQVLDLKYTVM